jgi:hypothetical protein
MKYDECGNTISIKIREAQVTTETKKCDECGGAISALRLEALPDTRCCVKCSTEGLRHDPNEVCAKSSLSARNGFGRED